MAREESDREDLMREATALRERLELNLPGEPHPLVLGRKRSGDVSLYFGPEPVYHFNAEGELRRAHADGFLYRSQGKTLARMERQRDETATLLVRHDLTAEELQTFFSTMIQRLSTLVSGWDENQVEILRRVPENDFPLEQFQSFLREVISHPYKLAPAVPGKR